jgi:hypothetical protein
MPASKTCAVKLFVVAWGGQRRCDIGQDLERSTRWVDKWWPAFNGDLQTGFADWSRGPSTVAKTSPEIGRLMIGLRKTFESSDQGLTGARSIRGKRIVLKVNAP